MARTADPRRPDLRFATARTVSGSSWIRLSEQQTLDQACEGDRVDDGCQVEHGAGDGGDRKALDTNPVGALNVALVDPPPAASPATPGNGELGHPRPE